MNTQIGEDGRKQVRIYETASLPVEVFKTIIQGILVPSYSWSGATQMFGFQSTVYCFGIYLT